MAWKACSGLDALAAAAAAGAAEGEEEDGAGGADDGPFAGAPVGASAGASRTGVWSLVLGVCEERVS